MKLTQIKSFLLSFLVVGSVATILAASGAVQDQTAFAYNCPEGEVFHDSDNACWIEDDQGTAVRCTSTSATGCGSGNEYKCQGNSQPKGDRCIRYTRTDSVPKNDDGSPLTLSCPSGLKYHATDNKCWKEEDIGAAKACQDSGQGSTTCKPCPQSGTQERDGRCIKYTESDENPILDEEKEPLSEDDKVAARDAVYEECIASGKSEDECKRQADQARRECEREVASNDANYSECMAKKSSVKNGECEDGSKPNATTGKCADGTDPKVVGRDGTGKTCGEAETILISCQEEGVGAINEIFRIVIVVVTLLIGIAAVGGLAWSAILYAKAEDNEGNTKEAKELIRNIVIGLLLYGFLVAIINWLVPGGVIG